MRHHWTVIAVFLVVVMAAMVHTFTTRPIYTAKTTLRLEKEEPRVVKFEEVVKTDPQPDYYQTQYKLLQSRALANRVVGLLDLDQDPEFASPEEEGGWVAQAQAWAREQLVQWMPLPPPPMSEGADDLILESPLTRAFLGRLSVEPMRNTRLVEASFESHYPDLAARVVNTLADAFIVQQVERKIEATRYATQFLAKQIEEAKYKLEESEVALTEFMGANNIIFVVPDSNEGRPQDLITQQLTILSDALLKARAERIGQESQFRQALGQEAASSPVVLQSALIAKLKEEQALLKAEYRKLSLTFKPDYPKVQHLTESIGEVRRQIDTEVRRVVDALKADYRAAVRNESQREKALLDQQGQVRQLDEQMGQYNLLRREVDTNRDLHNTLLNRLRETQIASALLTSNISIVDLAEVPGQPSKPRKMLNLLLASMVGLIGGIGLAFFCEYLDTNLKDMRDVESVLRVPTLGLVPSREALESRRSRRLRLGHAYDSKMDEAGTKQAQPQFELALRLQPTSGSTWLQLAQLADRLGGRQRARQALDTSMRLAPHNVRLRWEAALLMLRWGERDTPLEHLRYVLAADPGQADAAFLLASAVLDPEVKPASLLPAEPEPLMTIIRLAMQNGDLPLARAAWERQGDQFATMLPDL